MAKSKARLVVASEEVQGLVDKGFDVDVDLKNKTFEDKGIKHSLSQKLASKFGNDKSIRVEGEKARALVGRTEKFVINGDAESLATVREAVEKGLLSDAVEVEHVLNVPASDRKRAAEVLEAAGIKATTSATMKVKPEGYRTLRDSETSSVELADVKELLQKVIERSISYRIQYEKK